MSYPDERMQAYLGERLERVELVLPVDELGSLINLIGFRDVELGDYLADLVLCDLLQLLFFLNALHLLQVIQQTLLRSLFADQIYLI